MRQTNAPSEVKQDSVSAEYRHWRLDVSSAEKIPVWHELTQTPQALWYGYGVYTSFRLPLDEYWFNQHWQRLIHDAAVLGLALPATHGASCNNTWDIAVWEHLQGRHQSTDAPGSGLTCRLTILPDIAHFSGLFTPERPLPSVLIASCSAFSFPSFHASLPSLTGEMWEQQVDKSLKRLKLKATPYQRPLAGIKHTALGEALWLRRQAVLEGFGDVVWGHSKDNGFYLDEASTANLALIRKKQIVLPSPQFAACLPGITRLQLMAYARTCGWQVIEQPLSWEELSSGSLSDAEGLILTNAIQGVRCVDSIQLADTIKKITWPWPQTAQNFATGFQQQFLNGFKSFSC